MLKRINISKPSEPLLGLLSDNHHATTHTNIKAPLSKRENNPQIDASAVANNLPARRNSIGKRHHSSSSAALLHQEESVKRRISVSDTQDAIEKPATYYAFCTPEGKLPPATPSFNGWKNEKECTNLVYVDENYAWKIFLSTALKGLQSDPIKYQRMIAMLEKEKNEEAKNDAHFFRKFYNLSENAVQVRTENIDGLGATTILVTPRVKGITIDSVLKDDNATIEMYRDINNLECIKQRLYELKIDHNDLTSANILYDKDSHTFNLIDFGKSKESFYLSFGPPDKIELNLQDKEKIKQTREKIERRVKTIKAAQSARVQTNMLNTSAITSRDSAVAKQSMNADRKKQPLKKISRQTIRINNSTH